MLSEPNIRCKLWVEFAHTHTHSYTFQNVHMFTVCLCVSVGHGDNDVFEGFVIPEEDEEGSEEQKSGRSMLILSALEVTWSVNLFIYIKHSRYVFLIQPFLCILCVCVLVCVPFNIGHGETVQRIFDILRFLWAIVLAMVDGVTQWLNLLTKQYRDTSTVLCNERYLIIHKIEQVHTTQTTCYIPTHTLTHLYHNFVCFLPPCSIMQQQTPHMSRCLRTVRVPQWRAVWMKLLQKT